VPAGEHAAFCLQIFVPHVPAMMFGQRYRQGSTIHNFVVAAETTVWLLR